MAEFKAIRTALFGSVTSLFLSCAMLFGTTYAWFTDSVSSSNNRILAGNLDVDLLMYKTGKYVSIAEGSGDIFDEANGGDRVYWEPGQTRTVYLAVQNIGSLALKYDIKLDIRGGLADALEYSILDGVEANNLTATSCAVIQDGQNIKNGELGREKDIDYFALEVHMPEDAPIEFQGKSIIVDLKLVATQSSYGNDSLDRTYDENVVTISTIQDFKEFTEAVNLDNTYEGVDVANNPDVFVKLTGDLDLSEYPDFVGVGDGEYNSFDGVFDGCDHTIKNWTVDNQDKPSALFRTTKSVDIKNLTIDNFIIGKDIAEGNNYGILIGLIEGGDVVIDKVSIKNSALTGQETIGVIVGAMTEGHLTITNCDVEDITIQNAEGYTDAVGVLLGNGYSEKGYEESGFKEFENTISNVRWLSGDIEQTTVPAFNYQK